jgi:tetratricopeptide (TPR) repeat protein
MSKSKSQPPAPNSLDVATLNAFKVLFKAARREHAKAGLLAAAENPAHQAAMLYARTHRIPGGEALLAALLAAWKGGDLSGSLETLNAAKEGMSPALAGHMEDVAGMLLRELGQHDAAIACFEKAIATPAYDTPGYARNAMGLAYARKGEFDRAIECFQSAIATPGYDAVGAAYNNLGLALAHKGEFGRSIKYYEKALATSGFDGPGRAHTNMGIAYAALGKPERAIECYQKALATPGYGQPHWTRVHLAQSLRDLGCLQEAMSEIDRVLAEPDLENNHSHARYLKGLVEEELAGLKPSATEEALTKPFSGKTAGEADSPEARIVAKLRGSKSQERDKYDVYLRREGQKRDDVFSCLRGWSSAVTLLEGGQDTQWQGGGYFLKWQGRGIVIDPGFDFLDNFHDAGYNGREIDAVLVSHNHPDHNYDLGSVDDLRYELHRRWRVIPEAERKNLDLSKCLLVIDEDTAKAFKHDSPAHRGSPMKFDRANYEHRRWLQAINKLPLNIEHFPVSHGDDVPGAIGMKLQLLGPAGRPALVLGYTGDSEYSDALVAHLQGCDILLAHISMPDPEEYTDEAHLKKKHLGYNGLAKLIVGAKPRLTLVGEFWAGLADLRIDLTQGLRQRTKSSVILPTGVGFHLHLPTLEVECTCCRKRVPCESVRVAPASTPFGPLGYLCERCLV